jgi:hypothetical protein
MEGAHERLFLLTKANKTWRNIAFYPAKGGIYHILLTIIHSSAIMKSNKWFLLILQEKEKCLLL